MAIEYYTINDPSNVFYPFFKAEAMFYLGASDEAYEILNQTDPLYNDNWFYLRESTKLYFYLGEYEKSKIQLEKIVTQFPDNPPILMWLNALYAQMDGDSNLANTIWRNCKRNIRKALRVAQRGLWPFIIAILGIMKKRSIGFKSPMIGTRLE